ncbi:MAG: hypothetical protein V4513_01515 [Pseudomonadota bacterium]
MQFQLPKPLNGWRKFAGEVGVIVLGVLMALALQQAVEAWDWKQRADAAIEDMRIEYSGDNGPQAYVRIAIHDCLDARYVALRDAIIARNSALTRSALPAIEFPGRSYDEQSFEGAIAAAIVPHVSASRWQSVRAVYAAVPHLNERAQAERMLLAQLRAVSADAGALDPNARMDALRAIEQLRELNNRMQSSGFWMMQKAKAAGFQIDRTALKAELQAYGNNWRQCVADRAKMQSQESVIYSR